MHRDLKPSNLFLAKRRDGRELVKVLDFGISKLVSPGEGDTTQSGTMLGSPKYMSPEQMLSMSDVDARSDIWSLAAILYEFVTGRAPFHADTTPRVCALVLAADPTPPRVYRPDLPLEVESIILRCLQKERANRIPTLVELATALQPFGSDRSSLSPFDRVSHRGAARASSCARAGRDHGPFAGGRHCAKPLAPLENSDTRIDRVPVNKAPIVRHVAIGMTAGVVVPLLATLYMALRTPVVAAPGLAKDRPVASPAITATAARTRDDPTASSTSDNSDNSDNSAILAQEAVAPNASDVPDVALLQPSSVRPALSARPTVGHSSSGASTFGWTSTSGDVSPFAPATRTTPTLAPALSGTAARETKDPFQRSRW